MRVQRDTIYATRQQIMTAPTLDDQLTSVFKMATRSFMQQHPHPTRSELADYVLNTIDNHLVVADVIDQDWRPDQPKQTAPFLQQLMVDQLQKKFENINQDQQVYFERMCLLKSLDNAWIDQVDMLQQLRQIATSRSTAQHDPLLEYLKDGRKAFRRDEAGLCPPDRQEPPLIGISI
jgi:Preprotein translocase subunit SecA (ATPase, RNA helicase)